MTELLYLRDAYLREFDVTVLGVRADQVALDRSAFYPTGGGQPHDTGWIADSRVVDVRKEGDIVWRTASMDRRHVRARRFTPRSIGSAGTR
jgi:Ser-tRNA(Ala) deacylase AlaX